MRVPIINYNSCDLNKLKQRTLEEHTEMEMATRKLSTDVVKEI